MNVYLSIQHPQNLTTLVIHNRLRLLVIQHWHGEAPFILGVHAKVEVAQVGEALVAGDRVGGHILPRSVGVLGGGEAPAWGSPSAG